MFSLNKKRKVIFLDIDGVLQPLNAKNRFRNNLDKLREDLAKKYNKDNYLKYDMYDLGAIYYDWNKEAVSCLKKLLEETSAELVISSSWREYNPIEILKDYFKIHDLDKYMTEYVPFNSNINTHRHYRANLIQEYLEQNKDIEHFLVLDDINLSDAFPNNYVHTLPFFSGVMVPKSIMILNGKIFEMRQEIIDMTKESVIKIGSTKYKVSSKIKYQIGKLYKGYRYEDNYIISIGLDNDKFILYFPQIDWFFLSKDVEDLDTIRLLDKFIEGKTHYFIHGKFLNNKEKIFWGEEKIFLNDLMLYIYDGYFGKDAAYLSDLNDEQKPLIKLERINYNDIKFIKNNGY